MTASSSESTHQWMDTLLDDSFFRECWGADKETLFRNVPGNPFQVPSTSTYEVIRSLMRVADHLQFYRQVRALGEARTGLSRERDCIVGSAPPRPQPLQSLPGRSLHSGQPAGERLEKAVQPVQVKEKYLKTRGQAGNLKEGEHEEHYPWRFLSHLASKHFFHVFAVGYLTPPGSQAVAVHSDDQDVFILQVWGRKRWRTYSAPRKNPYSSEQVGKGGDSTTEADLHMLSEFDLSPGDLVYIPRGIPHKAWAAEQSLGSFHITLTVPSVDFSWAALLSHAMESIVEKRFPLGLSATSDSFLRRPLTRKSCFEVSGGVDEQEDRQRCLESAGKEVLELMTVQNLMLVHEERIKKVELLQWAQKLVAASLPQINVKQVGEVLSRESTPLPWFVGLEDEVCLSRGVTLASLEEEEVEFKRGGDCLRMNTHRGAREKLEAIGKRKGGLIKVSDIPGEDFFDTVSLVNLLCEKQVLEAKKGGSRDGKEAPRLV